MSNLDSGDYMTINTSYLSTITDPYSVVTAIDNGATFPEFMEHRKEMYREEILLFSKLISESDSSAELLDIIRTPKAFSAKVRMSLLKLFRRCVSTVCDTEATKKIMKTPTSVFVDNYGHTFKNISVLKSQFSNLSESNFASLSALIGEYDNRGEQGYVLTDRFFTIFEAMHKDEFTIEGPRGAGKDVQLSTVFPDFVGDYPCDFVIRNNEGQPIAVGFARYDSTRGGSQSDDRTGGNNDKVTKAKEFCDKFGLSFKVVFLSDGPGLVHGDTWTEACTLDSKWDDNVRVMTLKMVNYRMDYDWLTS